jgi:hypothetical protein
MKNVSIPNQPEFLGELQSSAYRHFFGFKSYKFFSSVFKPRDTLLLKDLAKNRDLIICRPDKGRRVVLVDRSRYNSSLTELITDPSKFVEITDPISKTTLKIEGKINNFLRKLKDSSAFSPETNSTCVFRSAQPLRIFLCVFTRFPGCPIALLILSQYSTTDTLMTLFYFLSILLMLNSFSIT